MIFRRYCCNPKTSFTAGSPELCINLPGIISILAILPSSARWPTPAAGGETEGRGRVPGRHQQARPVPPVCAARPEKVPADPLNGAQGGRQPEHGCRRRRPNWWRGEVGEVLLRAKGGAGRVEQPRDRPAVEGRRRRQGCAVAPRTSTAAPFPFGRTKVSTTTRTRRCLWP
jgi:hypothetical protein